MTKTGQGSAGTPEINKQQATSALANALRSLIKYQRHGKKLTSRLTEDRLKDEITLLQRAYFPSETVQVESLEGEDLINKLAELAGKAIEIAKGKGLKITADEIRSAAKKGWSDRHTTTGKLYDALKEDNESQGLNRYAQAAKQAISGSDPLPEKTAPKHAENPAGFAAPAQPAANPATVGGSGDDDKVTYADVAVGGGVDGGTGGVASAQPAVNPAAVGTGGGASAQPAANPATVGGSGDDAEDVEIEPNPEYDRVGNGADPNLYANTAPEPGYRYPAAVAENNDNVLYSTTTQATGSITTTGRSEKEVQTAELQRVNDALKEANVKFDRAEKEVRSFEGQLTRNRTHSETGGAEAFTEDNSTFLAFSVKEALEAAKALDEAIVARMRAEASTLIYSQAGSGPKSQDRLRAEAQILENQINERGGEGSPSQREMREDIVKAFKERDKDMTDVISHMRKEFSKIQQQFNRVIAGSEEKLRLARKLENDMAKLYKTIEKQCDFRLACHENLGSSVKIGVNPDQVIATKNFVQGQIISMQDCPYQDQVRQEKAAAEQRAAEEAARRQAAAEEARRQAAAEEAARRAALPPKPGAAADAPPPAIRALKPTQRSGVDMTPEEPRGASSESTTDDGPPLPKKTGKGVSRFENTPPAERSTSGSSLLNTTTTADPFGDELEDEELYDEMDHGAQTIILTVSSKANQDFIGKKCILTKKSEDQCELTVDGEAKGVFSIDQEGLNQIEKGLNFRGCPEGKITFAPKGGGAIVQFKPIMQAHQGPSMGGKPNAQAIADRAAARNNSGADLNGDGAPPRPSAPKPSTSPKPAESELVGQPTSRVAQLKARMNLEEAGHGRGQGASHA